MVVVDTLAASASLVASHHTRRLHVLHLDIGTVRWGHRCVVGCRSSFRWCCAVSSTSKSACGVLARSAVYCQLSITAVGGGRVGFRWMICHGLATPPSQWLLGRRARALPADTATTRPYRHRRNASLRVVDDNLSVPIIVSFFLGQRYPAAAPGDANCVCAVHEKWLSAARINLSNASDWRKQVIAGLNVVLRRQTNLTFSRSFFLSPYWPTTLPTFDVLSPHVLH